MLLGDIREKINSNKTPMIFIYSLLFLLLVIATLPRIKEFQDYGFIHSIADGFIIVNHIYIVGFLIIPCSMIITMIIFKNDFRQNYIIRQTRREKLWIKELIQISLINIPFILFITASVILINSIFTKDWINWNHEGSVYFAANRTLTDISLITVTFTYLINTYLLVLLMNVLFLGLYWLTGHYQISWLIYISIFIWDMVMFKEMNIIYKKLLMGYKYWQKYPSSLTDTFFFILIMFALILVFNNFFKRKEFIND
jgi:hypothetical protein